MVAADRHLSERRTIAHRIGYAQMRAELGYIGKRAGSIWHKKGGSAEGQQLHGFPAERPRGNPGAAEQLWNSFDEPAAYFARTTAVAVFVPSDDV